MMHGPADWDWDMKFGLVPGEPMEMTLSVVVPKRDKWAAYDVMQRMADAFAGPDPTEDEDEDDPVTDDPEDDDPVTTDPDAEPEEGASG